jgi:hypothetical protein
MSKRNMANEEGLHLAGFCSVDVRKSHVRCLAPDVAARDVSAPDTREAGIRRPHGRPGHPAQHATTEKIPTALRGSVD